MAVDFTKGITVASGFSLKAQAPLDVREVVETLADRNSLVEQNAIPEGAKIYVKATKALYSYNGTKPVNSDFTGCFSTVLLVGSGGGVDQPSAVLTCCGMH